MSSPWQSQEREWAEMIADRLREDGYEVLLEPSQADLPFGLGGYRPDLVASRDDEGLVIELKKSENKVPIDRYVEAAAIVRQHPGWRFILIPTERVEQAGLRALLQLPPRAELANHLEAASLLLQQRLYSAAFVTAWVGIEGTLRVLAEEQAVPISALSTKALILHSYSQGLISRTQSAALERLVGIRNRVVHGFVDAEVDDSVPVTLELLRELLSALRPEGPGI